MPPKKEEYESDESDDEMPIGNRMNNKKTPASIKPQISKVKKEEQHLKNSSPPSKKSTPRTTKPKKEEPIDDKKKVKRKQEEEKGNEEAKKRQKKVYDLPGQKRDPPMERDSLRIFYETLYEQKPTSELAAVWMMESGLLPLEEARKVYEKKMKKTKNQRITSPAKPVKTVVRETKSVTVVKKKVEAPARNSSAKKKTTVSTTVTKKSQKPKAESSEEDPSSDEESEEESEDDFAPSPQKSGKKAKAN